MGSLGTALIIFACVFSSAVAGMFLGIILPAHHLSDDSRDIVKLGTGLIATIAALVLSLLISSAKSSFDQMNNELIQGGARLILLDRTLAAYGPETREVRALLKGSYMASFDLLFSGRKSAQAQLDTPDTLARVEGIATQLRQLTPSNDTQRALKERALSVAGELAETRWLLLLQSEEPVPMALLVVLVAWLSIIFLAFGLFAPRNATAVIALLLSALCASGAIFLILEMNQPLTGFVRISSTPIRAALDHLGE